MVCFALFVNCWINFSVVLFLDHNCTSVLNVCFWLWLPWLAMVVLVVNDYVVVFAVTGFISLKIVNSIVSLVIAFLFDVCIAGQWLCLCRWFLRSQWLLLLASWSVFVLYLLLVEAVVLNEIDLLNQY